MLEEKVQSKTAGKEANLQRKNLQTVKVCLLLDGTTCRHPHLVWAMLLQDMSPQQLLKQHSAHIPRAGLILEYPLAPAGDRYVCFSAVSSFQGPTTVTAEVTGAPAHISLSERRADRAFLRRPSRRDGAGFR